MAFGCADWCFEGLEGEGAEGEGEAFEGAIVRSRGREASARASAEGVGGGPFAMGDLRESELVEE